MRFPRTTATVFSVLLLVNLLAVWIGGGWASDIAGDPDEPAHAVSSLMIRDFLTEGAWTAPRKFAEQYYANFPKVAIGHYPPVYYIVAAAALLALPEIHVLITLQPLLMAGLGVAAFAMGRRIAGMAAGIGAAALTVLVPLMWRLELHIMADLLLICLCLLAVLAWARFCEAPAAKWSLAFGALAALAILTKGSGILLAFVPAVTVVLRREWHLLWSWRWWLAAAPVALLAAPWMVATAGITKEGMVSDPILTFVPKALSYYAGELPKRLGYVWLALAGVGLFTWLRRAWLKTLTPLEAALLGVAVGCAAVITVIPAGLTDRYLAPAVPVLAILAMSGAAALASRLAPHARSWVVLAAAGCALAPVAQVPKKHVTGYASAVEWVRSQPGPVGRDVWLVGSDPFGEGGVIAEGAFRLVDRYPSPLRVYRGSKELAKSEWMGTKYESGYAYGPGTKFATEADAEAALLAQLDQLGVRWVFVDQSVPEHVRMPHELLLESALRQASGRWSLAHTQEVVRRWGGKASLLIYRRDQQPVPGA